MKLLGIAFFSLTVLCVCTVGEDGIQTTTVSANASATTIKSVTNTVNASTSQTTALPLSALTTTANRATDGSTTNNSTTSSPNVTQKITQDITTQPPVKVTTTAAPKSDNTTNTTQVSGTKSAHTQSLDVSSTTEWTSTISLQKNTSAPGTSGLNASHPTTSTSFGSTEGSSGNKNVTGSEIHYSSIILPIVITLIVITLSVFSLVALYRMCQKKTPERQENSTEQAQSDKEGVKLLSVKTTSSETGSRQMPLGTGEEAESLGRKPRSFFREKGPPTTDRSIFVEVRDIYEVGFSLPSANHSEPTPPPSGEVSQGRTTGEHSSQGKNKTRQLFTPQQ